MVVAAAVKGRYPLTIHNNIIHRQQQQHRPIFTTMFMSGNRSNDDGEIQVRWSTTT